MPYLVDASDVCVVVCFVPSSQRDPNYGIYAMENKCEEKCYSFLTKIYDSLSLAKASCSFRRRIIIKDGEDCLRNNPIGNTFAGEC